MLMAQFGRLSDRCHHKNRRGCEYAIRSLPRVFLVGGPMPKAKPSSLGPLSFEEAIDILLKAPPKLQKTKKKKA